jgi:hypothetical protein
VLSDRQPSSHRAYLEYGRSAVRREGEYDIVSTDYCAALHQVSKQGDGNRGATRFPPILGTETGTRGTETGTRLASLHFCGKLEFRKPPRFRPGMIAMLPEGGIGVIFLGIFKSGSQSTPRTFLNAFFGIGGRLVFKLNHRDPPSVDAAICNDLGYSRDRREHTEAKSSWEGEDSCLWCDTESRRPLPAWRRSPAW